MKFVNYPNTNECIERRKNLLNWSLKFNWETSEEGAGWSKKPYII